MSVKLWVGISIVSLFYLVAILAPWIAPYGLSDKDTRYALCPPAKIMWDNGRRSFFVYLWKRVNPQENGRLWELDRDNKISLSKVFLSFRLGQGERNASKAVENRKIFLWGVDRQGRDIFSMVIFGLRTSLFFSTIVAMVILVISLGIGMLAGYFGGVVDTVLMRACDLVMMVPGFYLLLAMRSGLPLGMDDRLVLLLVGMLVSLLGWPAIARAVRSEVLAIANSDFVRSARMMGLSDWQILWKHVLLYISPYVLAVFVMTVTGCILLESGLSVLGLGLSGKYVSLGSMLRDSLSIVTVSEFPFLLIPGFVLWIVMCGLYLLGDGIRDAFLADITL